jgi:hypothetical protein
MGSACHDRNPPKGPAVPGLDDIKKFADDHNEQVDQVLKKVGDAAAAKFGHEDQIDKRIDWAQQHTGGGDTQPADGQDDQQA